MGSKMSYSNSELEENLETYMILTYLKRTEIINIFNKFRNISPDVVDTCFHHRIDFDKIQDHFCVLKYNPFNDRICKVFSSQNDGKFSFEDVLDVFSVFSQNCPVDVKAKWAFRIFDFDDDRQIGEEDIIQMIKRITYNDNEEKILDHKSQTKITQILLKEMDLQHTGSIGELEFQHAMVKMSEFPISFYFKI